ncbi:ABC transporter permease [Demequina sp. NBRC 110052]|uniref:ABC transporter permease n=1 Tax=Demequina sp. NBRC 110052 TaxID=1570341 RepID=UPI0013564243|nr:ABC transporter permease [Demequina sp. NBRC 110052]
MKTSSTAGLRARATSLWQGATRHHAYDLGLLALALVVAVVFTLINPSVYASQLNVESIAFSVPEVGLMALAISIAMTVAGIDLSTVAVANLSALFIAWYSAVGEAAGQGPIVSTLIAVAGALVIGAVAGAVNGFVISRLKVAPILATLATMQIYTGLAIALTRGEAAYGVTAPLSEFGMGDLLGVPYVFWFFVLVVVVVWAIMTKTTFGLKATLTGASKVVSEFTGYSYSGVIVRAYVLTGVISALAGLVMVSRTASASAGYGSSYLMLAITIAVLGGANPFGGRVAITGAALAAVVLQLISSGLNMVDVSAYIYQIVQGAILAGVFVVTFERQRLLQRLARRRTAPPEPGAPQPAPSVVREKEPA